eukprot:TRINITY_DN2265_c0_g1_i26.p1 TRINITY_DN2265_c0_g1~~TRINITY_DN2265_c0_g1_i26.p1  ORF type:complete len:322 (-),score=54.42 TRINITY_DN2265_c0_g1_i26:599-1564(-)
MEDLEENSSHWEERLFFSEMMTLDSYFLPKISKISFSLLEDSGWYRVNDLEDHGNLFLWGKDEGCSFLVEDCSLWKMRGSCVPPLSRNMSDGNFVETEWNCSNDLRGYSNCPTLVYDSPLPLKYQHYENPWIGGPSAAADYCTILGLRPYGLNTNQPVWCNPGVTWPWWGQVYDLPPSERCFISTVIETGEISPHSVDPGPSLPECYATYCRSSGILMVRIGDYWYACPPEGGNLGNFLHFAGSMNCPPVTDICYDNTSLVDDWPIITGFMPSSVACNDEISVYGNFSEFVNLSVKLDTSNFFVTYDHLYNPMYSKIQLFG